MKDEIVRRAKRLFAKPMTNRDYLEAASLGLAAAMMHHRDKSPEEINEMALTHLEAIFASMAANAPTPEYQLRWWALVRDGEKANATLKAAWAAVSRGETRMRLDN